MLRPEWAAAAIALLSLALPAGYAWLKTQQPGVFGWRHLEGQWPSRTARFFYFVGLPYLAVIFGVLPVRLLGLNGLEHFLLIDLSGAATTSPGPQFQSALVLMLLEWLVDSGSTIRAGLAALFILGGLSLGLLRSGVSLGSGYSVSVLETIYAALHWAFYRAVFWLLTEDLYLGVVLGAGLVVIEWGLSGWLQGERQPQFWLNIIILLLTATVFFYSPNLWLLWPVHLAMVGLVRYVDSRASMDNVSLAN